ncbi:vWA domain-containing protein [Fulvimarina endophytica]|nr:vWA domain-containing protein [Fulvimarina endophytica]
MRWLRNRGMVFWLVAAAFVFAALAAFGPRLARDRDVRTLFFVVDLTRSMTARDYGTTDAPRSRLDEAKRMVTEIVRRLPCGSKVGLGVFTERRSFPLIEPVETCRNFAPFTEAVSRLDWRMAWEGDSRIVRGLASAQTIAEDFDSDLVFITDGQEAPPVPTAGRRSAGNPDTTAGLILGAGGSALVPIPKYDDRGNPDGFYSLRDIASGALVSIVPPDAERSGTEHPRNNPVGNLASTSNEHLTSVKADYLREIGGEAGLGYAPLGDIAEIEEQIEGHTSAHRLASTVDLSPIFGALALLSLFSAYAWNGLVPWRRSPAAPLPLNTSRERLSS